MKDFDWTSFTKRIAVKASLNDIYNAWTRSAEIEKWFLQKLTFMMQMAVYLVLMLRLAKVVLTNGTGFCSPILCRVQYWRQMVQTLYNLLLRAIV